MDTFTKQKDENVSKKPKGVKLKYLLSATLSFFQNIIINQNHNFHNLLFHKPSLFFKSEKGTKKYKFCTTLYLIKLSLYQTWALAT